jgi:hypothetical protein
MKKGLLLGAGFSYDLGMPLAKELTDVFLGIFNKRNVKSLATVLASNNPFTEERPINKVAILEGLDLLLKYKSNDGSNYEAFLSTLQCLSDLPEKTQSDRDSYHYLFSIFYDLIHKILSIYQIKSYSTIYGINKQWFSDFHNLLSNEETWAFTLNHDLYLECLAVDLDIPVTYGDNKEIVFPVNNREMSQKINFTYSKRELLSIKSSAYFDGEQGLNIVKLHGGISELEYKDRKIICNQILNVKSSLDLIRGFQKIEAMGYYHQGVKIPSGKDRVITNAAGELDFARKSMLTGGNKYSKTAKHKVGEEKLKIFDDVIREIDELTIIGYSFGDPHINFRISNAMVLNDDLTIRIVDPTNIKTPEFLEQFDYDSRINKAMCTAAEWMQYCKEGKWNTKQTSSLKENAKYRIQIKQAVEAELQEHYC